MKDEGGRREEGGGRRKAERGKGGRRQEEGGRRKAEGGTRKEEGGRGNVNSHPLMLTPSVDIWLKCVVECVGK